MKFSKRLEKTKNIKQVFDLVKEAVSSTLHESRAGLDIGFMELGNTQTDVTEAFYPVESNIIILNKTPIRRLTETNNQLIKPYLFTVLLHEYLHSLGYLDEQSVRQLAYQICSAVFEEEHPSIQIAQDLNKFLPYITYPEGYQGNPTTLDVIEVEHQDYIG
ncbi:MAG: hypothetical protein HY831_01485 [Candidatus Aenigmarchaeota archaeon]|nr:hypothetical protein [Candidatus Aenigmarchaeota archaeon]